MSKKVEYVSNNLHIRLFLTFFAINFSKKLVNRTVPFTNYSVLSASTGSFLAAIPDGFAPAITFNTILNNNNNTA